MAAIASISIASSTASNWLKEAQDSLDAAQNPGGILGALQNSKNAGSVSAFLAQSQSTADNLAQINSSTASSQNTLTMQMADAAQQKRSNERLAMLQKMNPQQTNANPPTQLDSFIYFGDGTTIDTVNNVLTPSDGTQFDILTGIEIFDQSSIINMANGAYLDTKKNIMTMSDGTKIDTVTGLKITA